METFADELTYKCFTTRGNLYRQGEVFQLAIQAFSKYSEIINEDISNEIEISYPIGYRADNTPIISTRNISKSDLLLKYQDLTLKSLPITGIYNLVTTMEALLGDIIRMVLIEFPGKIPSKRKLDYDAVLGAKSLEEIKLNLVNIVLNELNYKSPKEFAEEFNSYVGVNFLQYPSYHKYIEIKATRDIYIHNLGIANEIYKVKANTLARVEAGQFLPIDTQYFLQSYECCIQITEMLEKELHKIWPSSEYQKRKKKDAGEEEIDI